MDNRLKRVEFQPINLLSEAQIQSAVALGEAEDLTGREGIVASGAPNAFKRVVDAYIYSDKANGNDSGTTVELWVEARTGASNDNTIEVSGVRRASGVDVEVSGKYKLIEVDTEPWEERASFRPATPPENVIETLYYGTSVAAPDSWSNRRQLQTKRQIAKYSATTTSATLTMSSAHNFKAGDIISVELEDADIRLFGIDGLFRVKSVTETTIVYDFDVPIEEPLNEATLALPRFVYPVVREFIRDGATWVQEGSEEGDVVWVWKDYRWVNIRNYTGSDGVAPNPVTNLVATSKPNKMPGAETGTATIKLTWDAPTKDVNNKNLKDLAGYAVWWRQREDDEWRKEEFTGNNTVWEGANGFENQEPAYFRVYAKDSGNLLSTFKAIVHTPNLGRDENVKVPSPPAVTTYLGATRVEWNGKDFEEAVANRNTFQIELHWSNVPDFTPTADTLYERFPAIRGGAYLVIPNREFGTVNESLPDGTTQTATVHFKFVAVDVYGQPTAASQQTIANVQLNKIVKFAELDVDSFVGKSITGATYQTNNNVSTTGGIQFTKDFFVTYSPGGAETFRLNAKTGAVTIGSGAAISAVNQLNDIVQDLDDKINSETTGLDVTRALAVSQGGLIATATARADNAIVQANSAAVTANGLVVRTNTIENTANSAKTTAEAAKLTADGLVLTVSTVENTANGARTRVEAITDLSAGVVTVRKGPVVRSINGNTNQTTIDGGNITANSMNADRLNAGSIDARTISITDLTATNVNRGTLSGRPVQTSSGGGRILLNATEQRIDIFRSTTLAGTINATVNGLNIDSSESDSYLRISPGGITIAGNNLNRISFRDEGTLRVDQPRNVGTTGTGSSTLYTSFSALGGISGKAYVFTQLGGSLFASTSTSGVSDQRVKKDIETGSLGLNLINQITPVEFSWQDIELGEAPYEPHRVKTQYGLIAQELKEALESLGMQDKLSIVMPQPLQDEYQKQMPEEDLENSPILGIDYIQLVPILIKAIKELSARLDALET
jgi:hypothetical protein